MYVRIDALCKEKGMNITRMCTEAEVPRGNLTDLKNGRTAALSTKSLGKIANYFGVPVDFLIGNQPFVYWGRIEKDRFAFLEVCNIHPLLLDGLWGIKTADPYRAKLTMFIKFVGTAIVSAQIEKDGRWSILVKENFKGKTAGSFLKIGSPRMEAEAIAFRNDLLERSKEKTPSNSDDRQRATEKAAPKNEDGLTDAEYAIIKGFRELSPAQQDAVIAIVRSYNENH